MSQKIPPDWRIAVFLDRDGTINREAGYIDHLNKLHLLPGAASAIRLLNQRGIRAVISTNQSGVAKGYFSESFIKILHEKLEVLLGAEGARVEGIYYCPHHPEGVVSEYRRVCRCRKPEPGMLLAASRELGIDLARSYLVGDKGIDVECAHRVGAKGILVRTGSGEGVARDPDQGERPDYIAADLYEAVEWIVRDCEGIRERGGKWR